MEALTFLVNVPENDGSPREVKGIFSSDGEIEPRDLPVDQLRKNLGTVCQKLCTVLHDIQTVGDFHLKEVTVQVEVTAEGGVELIGTAKIGGKGAVTLTFSK